jgi:uncharacterized membrane protein YjjP (DUF1212 family)
MIPDTVRTRPKTRARLSIAARAVAALLGGYALASLVSALSAVIFPLPREEAILAGNFLALLAYPASAVWSFLAASAGRAWIGLLVPGIAMALAVWMLRGTL